MYQLEDIILVNELHDITKTDPKNKQLIGG